MKTVPFSGYAFCIYEQTINSSNLQNWKTLFIDDLCVDKTARGQHIGTELYNYVVKTAKEHGCYHITLNVWRLNEAAIAFYEKCGLSQLKLSWSKFFETGFRKKQTGRYDVSPVLFYKNQHTRQTSAKADIYSFCPFA